MSDEKFILCPKCKGRGYVPTLEEGDRDCNECSGNGMVEAPEGAKFRGVVFDD